MGSVGGRVWGLGPECANGPNRVARSGRFRGPVSGSGEIDLSRGLKGRNPFWEVAALLPEIR